MFGIKAADVSRFKSKTWTA